MKKSLFSLVALFLTLGSLDMLSRISNNISYPAELSGINTLASIDNKAITVEVTKELSINPYIFPDFKLRRYSFVRSEEGKLIFFSSSEGLAHIFGPRGENLGELSRRGEGPGEFAASLNPVFMPEYILVASGKSLIRFDINGKFVSSKSITQWPGIIVDDYQYLTVSNIREQGINKIQSFLSIVHLPIDLRSKEIVTNIFGPIIQGIYRSNGNRFIEPWATPMICYAYDHWRQEIYVALNLDYKIRILDLKGNIKRFIERQVKPIKTDLNDIESAYGSLFTIDPTGAKEIKNIYPKKYATIKSIQILKNGTLIIHRIVGMRKIEIDVFTKNNTFKCSLTPPKGLSFESAVFHDDGFSIVETIDDYPVYSYYKITNIKDIFGVN